ncbi:MAG: 4-alpha-glucanotransferase [Treponema sp.]|nr:4-alpha-glucanotransferase [Treponema sp.]
MKTNRLSGVLAHPTSFSGSAGIGTLGISAYKFIDWLSEAGQSLWQILPLGPTGYGDSPYASFSTFAGNPLLIDLDDLAKRGWADPASIVPPDWMKDSGRVDFGGVVYWKNPVLNQAADYFQKNCGEEGRAAYQNFKKNNAVWLDNYASFMTIKAFYDAKAAEEKTAGIWFKYWPEGLRSCEPTAIAKWNAEHEQEVERIKTIQFFFAQQWSQLKQYANDKGIKIIGDIPIFVAADSADVWGSQKLFQLEEDGTPKSVAGVPPDYFSATGQLWGNPLYDWDEMAKDGYCWWVSRIRRCLSLVDCVRIDHFRGFEAYWSVPYGEETAINGKWVPGPGAALFESIKKALGDIPIIAEDLGVITDGVRALRDGLGLPGMKVLQFAFDPTEAKNNGMVNPFLPHMFNQNCVVYTGTHDNQTMQGWLDAASGEVIQIVAQYAYGRQMEEKEARALSDSGELRNALIKAAMASAANMAVIPVQDILGVGDEGRMNAPSTVGTNWTWRFDLSGLTQDRADRLAFLSKIYGRNL